LAEPQIGGRDFRARFRDNEAIDPACTIIGPKTSRFGTRAHLRDFLQTEFSSVTEPSPTTAHNKKEAANDCVFSPAATPVSA
jgi:hypothetical protein